MVSHFDNAADCFPKKPWFFCSRSANDKWNKQRFVKTFSFAKLIPWTRKRQCRQPGRKKFEQRLINLRSMSVIDGEKKLDKAFFTTNWSNWQTESSTDIGTDKISSKWHKKVAQCPMMKKRTFSKKTFSKNLHGYVVSKCDKFADCFFDKKKRYSSVQFSKNMKKKQTKPLSKQSFVLKFFLWTRRMQFCQTDRNIFGKKEQTNFCWMSVNDGEKSLDKHFFTRNWSNWQTENSTDIGTDKFSSKGQAKVDQCPMIK